MNGTGVKGELFHEKQFSRDGFKQEFFYDYDNGVRYITQSRMWNEFGSLVRNKKYSVDSIYRFHTRPSNENKNVSLRKKSKPRYAGGRLLGMEHLPKNLQMKAEHLWNEIQQYHGDKISELLAEVPENEKITYASEHNGTWYFYKVNKDHTIEVINATKASNDSKIKSLLKEYGLDTDTREFRNSLQADEDGGNGRVFEDGSNASDRRGLAGTNSIQDREGGWKQALETLRVDEQNSRSNASSNSSASTPIDNNDIRFSIGQSNT